MKITKKLFGSRVFLPTLSLTFRYAVTAVFLKLFLGFVMALFLNSEMYFSKLLRFLSLLPWATTGYRCGGNMEMDAGRKLRLSELLSAKNRTYKREYKLFVRSEIGIFAAAFVDAWLGLPMVSMMFLASLQTSIRHCMKVQRWTEQER